MCTPLFASSIGQIHLLVDIDRINFLHVIVCDHKESGA